MTKARSVPVILINTTKQNVWIQQPLLATELLTADQIVLCKAVLVSVLILNCLGVSYNYPILPYLCIVVWALYIHNSAHLQVPLPHI